MMNWLNAIKPSTLLVFEAFLNQQGGTMVEKNAEKATVFCWQATRKAVGAPCLN